MKRKTFMVLSALTASAIGIPWYLLRHRNGSLDNMLSTPQFLVQVCDKKSILEIGASYRKQVPTESNQKAIVHELLSDSNGRRVSDEISSVRSFLEKKVREDFDDGKIVIVNGWVLSVTEARQCAMYSLTQ